MPDAPQAPPVETPASLLAAAADRRAQQRWHEGQAAFHEGMARSFAREAASLEERAALHERDSRLPIDDTDDTLPDVNVDTRGKSVAVRRASGRARRKHPAQAAFYKHNKTIGEVALEIGEGRPRVSSWMADGEDCRAIPLRVAKLLLKKYGIPLTAWLRLGD